MGKRNIDVADTLLLGILQRQWAKLRTETKLRFTVTADILVYSAEIVLTIFFFFVSLHSGHLAVLLSFFLSVYPLLRFLFSCCCSPPHIRSRGLSRLLTFLWPSLYYVGTIRFIPTRFTNVTLTTLLSACVCLCACVCFMDLTSLRVNDVWKRTEEFRLLKVP